MADDEWGPSVPVDRSWGTVPQTPGWDEWPDDDDAGGAAADGGGTDWEAEVVKLQAEVRRQAEHYLSDTSLSRPGGDLVADVLMCGCAPPGRMRLHMCGRRWPDLVACYSPGHYPAAELPGAKLGAEEPQPETDAIATAASAAASREPQMVDFYSKQKRLAAAALRSVPIELLVGYAMGDHVGGGTASLRTASSPL